MLSALLFSHFCPKQAKMKPNKRKALHSAEREFGGTLGEPLFVYIYICLCMYNGSTVWLHMASVQYLRSFVLLTRPGATCIPVFLPLTVLYLLSVCRSPEASVLQWPPPLTPAAHLWDPLAAVLVVGWITLQSFLYLLPIGKVRYCIINFFESHWIIFWGKDVRFYTNLFVYRFLKDWSSEMDPDWNIP